VIEHASMAATAPIAALAVLAGLKMKENAH